MNGAVGYWELFVSAFVSSTLLPGGSEAVLAYLVTTGDYRTDVLVLSATVGNTLGAITTWCLGLIAAKKYPVAGLLSKEQQNALTIVQARGRWVLFFSWLPIVGDALCFAGGWLKLPLVSAVLIIFSGKLCRYLVVAGLFV